MEREAKFEITENYDNLKNKVLTKGSDSCGFYFYSHFLAVSGALVRAKMTDS